MGANTGVEVGEFFFLVVHAFFVGLELGFEFGQLGFHAFALSGECFDFLDRDQSVLLLLAECGCHVLDLGLVLVVSIMFNWPSGTRGRVLAPGLEAPCATQ